MMDKRDRNRREKKKQEQRRRIRSSHLRKKRRSLHIKHKKRRKKDCMVGVPFVIAFHGDPARLFYCADYPVSYELIPRTSVYPAYMRPFERLGTFGMHHVTQIHGKILIFEAGCGAG